MVISLIVSLFLTVIIELVVSLIIGIRGKEDLKVVFLANVITNPIVVFTANCVSFLNNEVLYYVVVFILELLAIIVEFIIFKKFLNFKKKSPLFISCINNIISFSLGVVISIIINSFIK